MYSLEKAENEEFHYKETLSLIQLITNHGAFYQTIASESNIFVAAPNNNDEERGCSRLSYVNDAIKEGAKIEIISFKKLLSILQTDEKKLSDMSLPEIGKSSTILKDKNKSITTLGDFLREQGVDLRKIN